MLPWLPLVTDSVACCCQLVWALLVCLLYVLLDYVLAQDFLRGVCLVGCPALALLQIFKFKTLLTAEKAVRKEISPQEQSAAEQETSSFINALIHTHLQCYTASRGIVDCTGAARDRRCTMHGARALVAAAAAALHPPRKPGPPGRGAVVGLVVRVTARVPLSRLCAPARIHTRTYTLCTRPMHKHPRNCLEARRRQQF